MLVLQLFDMNKSAPAPNTGPELQRQRLNVDKLYPSSELNSLRVVTYRERLLDDVELRRRHVLVVVQGEEEGLVGRYVVVLPLRSLECDVAEAPAYFAPRALHRQIVNRFARVFPRTTYQNDQVYRCDAVAVPMESRRRIPVRARSVDQAPRLFGVAEPNVE